MKTEIPHALPYGLYVAAGAAGSLLGDWTDAVRFALAGTAFAVFYARGAYPELAVRPRLVHSLAGVAVGVAIGLLWVPLAEMVPLLPLGKRDGISIEESAAHALVFRFASMVLLAPLVEELFVRSAVPRLVDTPPTADWRNAPLGRFTALSFAISVAFFTFTHPEWLAALVTGATWSLLLMWTRSLTPLVVSHAVANACLALHVVSSGDTKWW